MQLVLTVIKQAYSFSNYAFSYHHTILLSDYTSGVDNSGIRLYDFPTDLRSPHSAFRAGRTLTPYSVMLSYHPFLAFNTDAILTHPAKPVFGNEDGTQRELCIIPHDKLSGVSNALIPVLFFFFPFPLVAILPGFPFIRGGIVRRGCGTRRIAGAELMPTSLYPPTNTRDRRKATNSSGGLGMRKPRHRSRHSFL